MVRSEGGVLSCTNRMRNEGIAITTRMITGMTVQATSIRVLWVVRDGVGLAFALNLTMQTTSKMSTNAVIAAMIQSRKLWNQMMSSIVGAADCWKWSGGGRGGPRPAKATPPAASAATKASAGATFPINRMSTSIGVSAPSSSTFRHFPSRNLQAARLRVAQDARKAPALGG